MQIIKKASNKLNIKSAFSISCRIALTGFNGCAMFQIVHSQVRLSCISENAILWNYAGSSYFCLMICDEIFVGYLRFRCALLEFRKRSRNERLSHTAEFFIRQSKLHLICKLRILIFQHLITGVEKQVATHPGHDPAQ